MRTDWPTPWPRRSPLGRSSARRWARPALTTRGAFFRWKPCAKPRFRFTQGCWRTALVARKPREIAKILVIKLGALGDFVQALAAMEHIRAAHPKAHITLLTTPPFE